MKCPDTDPIDPMRRRLLQGSAAAFFVNALPAVGAEWNNWSAGQRANPSAILYPPDEPALVKAIRTAQGPIRAVGGSHSFSPVVPTPGTIISIEALNGLVRHDAQLNQATLWAGTRLGMASAAMAAVGQSFVNEPDINLQSLGGAVSTATHGTGRSLQCLSAYVTGMRLVTADGSIIECSTQRNTEVFEAARVAIGSLGIITQVTFQNMPLYRLRETTRVMDLDEAVALVESEKDQRRHIEFWAFLAGDEAIVKSHDFTDDAVTEPETPSFDENRLLEFAAEISRKHPWLNRWVQELLGLFVSDSTRVGESWQVFASPRAVGFNEMEYQIPADRGLDCFWEIHRAVNESGIQVFFPIEFRYVKGDGLWLSPFYQRDSVSISIHQYYKQEYRPLFGVVEPIFRKYGGRPHWGKLHSLKATELAPLYPRWKDFLRTRKRLDPKGLFLNAYMHEIFGLTAS